MISSIALEGVRREYPGSRFCLTVDGLDLNRGIHVLLGPNGSGKSTLLKLLALAETPDAGTVRYHTGNGPEDFSGRDSRRKIGFVMQDHFLFNMSVRENVRLGLRFRKCPPREIDAQVDRVLAFLRIDHLAGQRVGSLSGGEYRKTAIAQVLVFNPEVVFLDEPTAQVDTAAVRGIESLLRDLYREKGTMVVLTTHSRDQAYRMSPNIISLVDGMIRDVAPENIFYGSLAVNAGGPRIVTVSEQVKIQVSDGQPGKVTLAVDPQDIILSREKLSSSALNNFNGTIMKVEGSGNSLRVFVDIGIVMCTVITQKSFNALDFQIGGGVWIAFKANAVKIL